MASLSTDKDGNRRILFMADDGSRKAIRLGKLPKKTAESILTRVEYLAIAKKTGCPVDNETARWIAGLSEPLRKKIVAVGLIEPKEKTEVPLLGKFIDDYIAGRANLKPNTRRNYETTRRNLVDYFNEKHKLASITPGDADQWREHLLQTRSLATVSREVKRAKQFFRAAVRKRFIPENPFADLKAPAQVNQSREFFVTTAVIEKVIAACPDAEWRLILALSRYGGLRCPSEHLELTWGDIDWERERMTVRSPKTEHNPGGESRVIPLFPELRPHLEAAFDEAEPGTKHVIRRYRDRNSNLRSQFLRIIERAGEKPWPRLFHNLRASRQTELTSKHPLHVVCAWIGNSAAIADKHYLQVTEDHFAKATAIPPSPAGGAESGALSTQKPAQQAAAEVSSESQEMKNARINRAILPPFASPCDGVLGNLVPPTGVEPVFSD